MKHFLLVVLFTLATSLIYTGVGQVLPQLENHPPPEIRAGSEIGPEELAEAGAAVFETNCGQCHKLGEKGRGPDLANVGASARDGASKRKTDTGKDYTDVDYLVESLCAPGAYLVDGFGNIMPPQSKALSGGQLLAVTAFLQTLGGEATVKGTDVEVLERFDCATQAGGSSGPVKPVGPPEQVWTEFACVGCHALDTADRKVGPSLQGIGERLNKGELYDAILDPDVDIPEATPPYPKGVMGATLGANDFYNRMGPTDIAALVNWLAEK